VLAACAPDLVILQEATSVLSVRRIAEAGGFASFAARRGASLACLGHAPVQCRWHKPWRSRHAFLEVQLSAGGWRIFGVHLSAVHSAITEQRRLFELAALLRTLAAHRSERHLVTGDFNTLAPGERLDLRRLPLRLRPMVWLTGGRIRFRTIERMIAAEYVDGFRRLHPEQPGATFPAWGPHLRLDYAFVPAPYASDLSRCDVIRTSTTREASDHLPLLVEVAAVDRTDLPPRTDDQI
jgi:exodeoxyribonuclease-3